MVMDSFDLNKPEQMPNLPTNYEVDNLQTEGMERPLNVPDRSYEQLTRSNVENDSRIAPKQQSHSSAVPASTVVRQPITAVERFNNLEASDGDLIESVWVSNVKKTLEMTKNQPNRRDDEINEIRKIYQEKRKVS